jgi:hypothetical protein
MWDEKTLRRLTALLLKKEQNRLSVLEVEELRSLTEERIHAEAEALGKSTRQIIKASEQTHEESREIEAQSRALEELIREQQSYLAEVKSMIAEMENRRHGWRTRYKRITGRSLRQPTTPTGGAANLP